MDTTKNALGAAVLFMALAGALPAAAAGGKSGTEHGCEKEGVRAEKSAYFGVNRNLGRASVEVALAPYVDQAQ
jgi:hypothetical protein